MHRREYLGAAATAGLVGLAGCSQASGAVAPPEVPEDLLSAGNWEQVDSRQETVFEQSYGPVTVTADANTLVFEDVGLRDELAEKTLDQVSGQFSLFSATHVELRPGIDELPAGVGRGQILDRTEENARRQFRREMEAAGLANVEQVETGTLTVDTGEDARLTSYAAEFPFQDVSFEVAAGETITIEGAPIRVAGDLAVWHHGGFVVIAGGAYPGENFTRNVTKELSSAITVDVSVDLGLTPDAYREEVRGLMRATE